MPSTNAPVTVASVQLLAQPIVALLLQPRDITLSHEAPKSTYAHQVRRNVACSNATPVEMMLAVSLPDADDPRIAPKSLLSLMRREQRFEHAENDSALVLLSDENNIDNLETFLRNSARERAAQEEIEQLVREKIAELRLRQTVAA